MRNILLVVTLYFVGCATPLTPEEREWRRGIDAENWAMCEAAYNQHGASTIHRDHSHERKVFDRGRWVKQDLADNRCRQVLDDYWAEY